MADVHHGRIFPAGWPLRRFGSDELESFLLSANPGLVEISKDYVDSASLKRLAQTLSRLRERATTSLSFAGTTDLVHCSGFSWDTYRRYLGVQVAQARFLGCSVFRILLGTAAPNVSPQAVIQRLLDFVSDLDPIEATVEIHATWESELTMLRTIIAETPASIVVDFENMRRGGLTLDTVLEIVPRDRIAYCHQRNLGHTWIEHDASREDESRCRDMLPGHVFLWEPKTIDSPATIQEVFREYQSAH